MWVAHEVDADTPLSDVLERMVTHQWDVLVVTRAGRIDGIFTAMDAVRVLLERTRVRRPELLSRWRAAEEA